MKYDEFLKQMSDVTRYEPDAIREILGAMPLVLSRLQENESVRITGLGMFKMRRFKGKRVKVPKQPGRWASSPTQIRLWYKPPPDLRVNVDDED